MGCRARACSTRSERQWQRRCPAGCPRTIFGKERPLLSVIQRPLFAPWRMKRCVAHGEAPILKRGHAGAVRRASVRAACLANGRSILQAALVQRAFTPRSIFRGKSLPRAVEYLAVIADLFDHINCPGVFEAKVLPDLYPPRRADAEYSDSATNSVQRRSWRSRRVLRRQARR